MAERWLKETHEELAAVKGGDLERVLVAVAQRWEGRFADLLDEDPGAVPELRALTEEIHAALPAGVVSATDHAVAAGRDVNITARQGVPAARVRAGGDTALRLVELLDDDPEVRANALGQLDMSVLHQGSHCSATPPAALFIAAILGHPRMLAEHESAYPWDDRRRPFRAALIEWLGQVAESAAYEGPGDGVEVEEDERDADRPSKEANGNPGTPGVIAGYTDASVSRPTEIPQVRGRGGVSHKIPSMVLSVRTGVYTGRRAGRSELRVHSDQGQSLS